MKSVFIKDGAVVSVITAHAPGVVVTCAIPGAEERVVPDESPVDTGWTVAIVDGSLVFAAPASEAPKVSPVQFKLLFTSVERIAIKTSTDPVLQDFFEIVNDPRLTSVDLGLQSTKDALWYLASNSLIAPGRVDEILMGKVK